MMFQEKCIVKSIEKISVDTFEVHFFSPNIANSAKSGQFVNILPNADWKLSMRRPMSIASCTKDLFSIIFRRIGAGTGAMANWQNATSVDIIGPLGNNWSITSNHPILIAGGIGLAPVLFLHKDLARKGIEHETIFGGRSAQDIPEKFRMSNWNLCTDDGSLGFNGNVVGQLLSILDYVKDPKIFACGPNGMLQAIQKVCDERNIPSEFAMEAMMACGVGNCQGCVVNLRNDKEAEYALVCKDGPVFDGGRIQF